MSLFHPSKVGKEADGFQKLSASGGLLVSLESDVQRSRICFLIPKFIDLFRARGFGVHIIIKMKK